MGIPWESRALWQHLLSEKMETQPSWLSVIDLYILYVYTRTLLQPVHTQMFHFVARVSINKEQLPWLSDTTITAAHLSRCKYRHLDVHVRYINVCTYVYVCMYA